VAHDASWSLYGAHWIRSVHTPSETAPAATEQASQEPALHAVSQQTPSTQWPLWHTSGDEHGIPGGSRLKISTLESES
jgi:hypothetical protein